MVTGEQYSLTVQEYYLHLCQNRGVMQVLMFMVITLSYVSETWAA